MIITTYIKFDWLAFQDNIFYIMQYIPERHRNDRKYSMIQNGSFIRYLIINPQRNSILMRQCVCNVLQVISGFKSHGEKMDSEFTCTYIPNVTSFNFMKCSSALDRETWCNNCPFDFRYDVFSYDNTCIYYGCFNYFF